MPGESDSNHFCSRIGIILCLPERFYYRRAVNTTDAERFAFQRLRYRLQQSDPFLLTQGKFFPGLAADEVAGKRRLQPPFYIVVGGIQVKFTVGLKGTYHRNRNERVGGGNGHVASFNWGPAAGDRKRNSTCSIVSAGG